MNRLPMVTTNITIKYCRGLPASTGLGVRACDMMFQNTAKTLDPSGMPFINRTAPVPKTIRSTVASASQPINALGPRERVSSKA